MKKKKKLIILLAIIFISIFFTSCNKKQAPTASADQQEETVKEEITKEDAVSEEKIVEEVNEEEPVFDESSLGYNVVDNKVFLNDKALPTVSEVSQTIREKDKTTYQFYDGATLVIKTNGDIIVDFPIKITLLINNDFTTFKTLYKGESLTNAIIKDFKTENNWYTIDYGNNAEIKFNNETLIFNTNNLQIIQKQESCETIFKDFIISTSKINKTDTISNIIKIEYEDNTQLTHIIGGATTFIFSSGTSIESDGQITKVKKDGEETVIKGELTNINFNKETGDILFETSEEIITLNPKGEVIQKEVLFKEPVEDFVEEPIEESTIEEQNFDESTTNSIEEEENIDFDTEFTSEEEENFDDTVFNDEDNLIDDAFLEQDILGDWNGDEIELIPYRIGAIGNFSFLQINSLNTQYGGRVNLLIENEIKLGTVIGLEIGIGADKLSNNNHYKQLVTNTTFSQEITPKYSKVSYFYKIKFGSLIPLAEEFNNVDETPYIRLGLELGTNFNINTNWMIRLGLEAAINYKNAIATSQAASLGLIYKFK